jgi:hypothetical protein
MVSGMFFTLYRDKKCHKVAFGSILVAFGSILVAFRRQEWLWQGLSGCGKRLKKIKKKRALAREKN